MSRFLLLFVILFLLDRDVGEAMPTATSAVKYLQRYGYLNVPDNEFTSPLSEDEIKEGIRLFQSFVGLEKTGTLDQATLEMMEMPRCGVPDILGGKTSGIAQRYNLIGTKWEKRRLTYRQLSFPTNVTQVQAEREIARGFEAWESVSSLWIKAALANETADMESSFVTGDHGDGFPFDGPGDTLAHAFYPQTLFEGAIHFDDEETWIISEGTGYKLRNVASHEMGHSLGIAHSASRAALMFPFYNPNIADPQADDILAIRALYPDAPETPIAYSNNLGKCSAKFDAVTTMKDGSVYAFSEKFFWELNDQGIVKDSMEEIENVWGFRGDIDAILTHDGFTDFFQGLFVRRYINKDPVKGYPRLISDQYPGMPSNIDAAWSRDGIIYFMKDGEYWAFNSATSKAYTGYPRRITKWSGLPNSIDAAVQWNDNTYFFKDGQYWRFSEKHETKDSKDPQKSNKWWPGCFESSPSEVSDERSANGAGSTSAVGRSVQVAISLVLFGRVFIY